QLPIAASLQLLFSALNAAPSHSHLLRLLPIWGNRRGLACLLALKVGFSAVLLRLWRKWAEPRQLPQFPTTKWRDANMQLRATILTLVMACATYGVAQVATPDQSQQKPSSSAATQQQTPSQQQSSNQSTMTPS